MSTPEGAFSVFPLAAAVTAPAGALSVFHHYRSSDCSPQERYLYFPTAAAVSAPAGALSIFPHCRSSARSSRSLLFPPPHPKPNRFFPPTAAAVPAPAGAFSVFPPLPQQCLLPKEPFLYFPSPQQWLLQQERYLYFITTAVVTAPLRSATCISPLPQQWLLPQERYLYSLTAAAVLAPAGAFSSPPLPLPTSRLLHCRSSACSSRNLLYIPLPQ